MLLRWWCFSALPHCDAVIQHSKMHRIMAIRDEMKRKIIILKSGGKNALFI
jgi:hypothetical protein